MPSLNSDQFALAIELAAPSLADGLLRSPTTQSVVVHVIVNAYNAIGAAQKEITGPRD
jgi:hypothetical protein